MTLCSYMVLIIVTYIVRELHGLTCSNHTHNLAGEAWWGSWRHSVVEAMERQNAVWLLSRIWKLRRQHRLLTTGE